MTRITRTRLVAAAALGAASVAGLTACTAAAEPAAEKTAVAVADASTEAVLQQNRLSVESAMTAAQAALAQCQADGLGFVSVAVVDRYGQTQASSVATTPRSTRSKPRRRRRTRLPPSVLPPNRTHGRRSRPPTS
jgi:hypothetical protein